MKKVLSLLLALVICLSLCACGSDGKNNSESTGAKVDVIEEIIGKWIYDDGNDVWTYFFYENGFCSYDTGKMAAHSTYSITETNILIDGWGGGGLYYTTQGNALKLSKGDHVLTRDDTFTTRIRPMTEEEIFAANILIGAAKAFDNPTSIIVKNAWYFADYFGNYFTYQIEFKNEDGIVETSYFGNNTSFSDLSDETLDKALDTINTFRYAAITGGDPFSFWFREDEITGMQQGTQICSDMIQEYFLKNYE